jgi:hypothetical protein
MFLSKKQLADHIVKTIEEIENNPDKTDEFIKKAIGTEVEYMFRTDMGTGKDICSLAAVIMAVRRGESKNTPFYVDLAFESNVEDFFIMKENLLVDVMESNSAIIELGKPVLIEAEHSDMLINTLNECRREIAEEKERNKQRRGLTLVVNNEARTQESTNENV